MNSQSSNSQSTSLRKSSSRREQETQIEHFFGKKTSWVTYLVVLIILGAIGGGAYWFLVHKKAATGAPGVKSLTDSA